MLALIAGLICLLVYLRALSCGFVNLDDPDYVLNNPLIRQLDGELFRAAFTQAHVGWWMPLTWISLAVDYHFWGLNPVGYHLTNILLHTVNTGLVVLIADRLYRHALPESLRKGNHRLLYPATLLLAGLLFGLHPLRVESVTWVTERKDVLNGLFSLGAVVCYLRYAERARESKGAGRLYVASLGFFICSLMAKSVSVVLPVMLLVLDWYPLGRWRQGVPVRQLLGEKLPFLVLSLLMSAATMYFTAQTQYLVSYDIFPFSQRLVVSGTAIVEYCRLLLVPVGIIPLFMIPDPIPFDYTVKAIVAGVICIGIYLGRKHVWLPATWLTFIFPLLPVLAFFQNGDQAYAARFTYLPSLGPSIAAAGLLAVGYGRLARLSRWGGGLLVTAIMVLLMWYAGMTLRLIAVWDNPGTLWSRVIAVEPGAQAYKERGVYHYNTGNHAAAVDDFTQAISLVTSVWRPYVYNLYAYRGEALWAAGRYSEAIQDLTAAIDLNPRPSYYHYRGLSLQALGRGQDAAEDFRRAGPAPGSIDWYWDARKDNKK
ncbi:MAG: hypothetical protein CXR31_10655 [Geobacter sp.]|nr:MAG: hypothetical protein CXR31_10655 [Geobacter sp.]